MKKRKSLIIVIIFISICLLTPLSIQGAPDNKTNLTKKDFDDENNLNSGDVVHYSNCRIIVFGKCNTVRGPLVWLFGFYCPLLPRQFWIEANGDQYNESLNLLVFGGGNFGTYYDLEQVSIDIRGAKGFLYYFGKSLVVSGNNIFAFCKADDIFINT